MENLAVLSLIAFFLWLLFKNDARKNTTHYRVMIREQEEIMDKMHRYAGSVGLSRESFFWLTCRTPGPVNLGDWMNFVDAHKDAWFEHVERSSGNYNSRKAWNKAFLEECCNDDDCPLHNKTEE